MIDLYCERLGPGFWAEPVNAFSNLSFILASLFLWLHAKKLDLLNIRLIILISLVFAIGVGSSLFHTYATYWAQVLDVLPILLFQIAFIWIYSRQIIRLPVMTTGIFLVVFALMILLGRQFYHLLNGSLIYLPAFLVLAGLAIYHRLHARAGRNLLLLATGAFTVSLFFRIIDLDICDSFSMGTHFLWHLFNSLLLYLAVRAIMLSQYGRQSYV